MSLNTAISQALDIIARLITAAFIIVMAATLIRYFGVNVPTPTDLAYTAGAWWLIRKAG
jgi:hypothetical protein